MDGRHFWTTNKRSRTHSPASRMQFLQGWMALSMRPSTSFSNSDLVILTFMCLGPVESAVIKGRDTSVWGIPSSSRFACTIPMCGRETGGKMGKVFVTGLGVPVRLLPRLQSLELTLTESVKLVRHPWGRSRFSSANVMKISNETIHTETCTQTCTHGDQWAQPTFRSYATHTDAPSLPPLANAASPECPRTGRCQIPSGTPPANAVGRRYRRTGERGSKRCY